MVAVKTGATAPLSLTFDGKPLMNMGLCVGMEVHQSVIAQFQNTFGNYIYITPFGDKPGEISLSFIINSTCDTSVQALNVVDFYIKSRLQPTQILGGDGTYLYLQKNVPIIVAVGSLSLRGFVTGLDMRGSTDGSAIISATLRMTGWPA
jgi:hypothetical protein